MAKAMFKPDVQLDGEEFSAVTRLIEALHDRKEIGVEAKMLDSAKDAKAALELNAPVAVEDVKNLLKAAKGYQKAIEDKKLELVPNVKDLELEKIIRKLEGMAEAGETTDENGKKIHPAAQPAGKEEEKPEASDEAGVQAVKIVETPESKKAKHAKK